MRWQRRVTVLMLLAIVTLARAAAPSDAIAQQGIALATGCNNVSLAYAAGTPISTIAGMIQPAGALQSIFHYDAATQRFTAFAPAAPESLNDYLAVGTRFEPVFICMNAAGTLASPIAATAPPPAATAVPAGVPGILSAPASVMRGQFGQIVIGTQPNIACVGGINIPFEQTFRFVEISQGASAAGLVVIDFEVQVTDARGTAYLAVRCADLLVIRFSFQIV